MSPSPVRRRVGIAACAIHRVDPREHLRQAFADPDPQVRARALRAAGELGRHDLVPELQEHALGRSELCRFWAAWSAVRLGDRASALDGLMAAGTSPSLAPYAVTVVPRVLGDGALRDWLKNLPPHPRRARLLILAAGAAGDPAYVPWLLKQMEVAEVARAAGEAFSMITGVDLEYEDFDGRPPEERPAGPPEDPEDEQVDSDEDEDLPWPDPERVRHWWDANGDAFQAGRRYLRGRKIDDDNLLEALSRGYQRQRAAAALELALRHPQRLLFEVRAPAARQIRELRSWTSSMRQA